MATEDTQELQPPPTVLEICDDLVHVAAHLAAQIEVLQKSPKKSRERSLIITKLQEAKFWASEGMAQGDGRNG